ncbi:DMT family transporter [Salipiger sp. P9]|uniref:DMT family transporter n=1 Tax=Salipiger pentaromativorans TaxID=2943193 RepID=UPI002158530E|nr:DMT family transporter [Salipiger pentaromativorans]MCR8549401.1 DMT family transporter [Salipiger pentaromativorans]
MKAHIAAMDVRPNPPLAAALTLLASAFVAGTTLLAKMLGTETLGPPLHPLQVSQGRFLFALMAFSSAALILRPRLTRPAWATHTLRVVFGWGGVSFMFAAAAFIPLSDATAISFLNPVVAMLLAIPLLGEKVGRWRVSAAVIAVVGAMVLLRPTPEAFQPAALLALGAALSLGCELVVIKRLTQREGAFQILLINNLIGALIASAAALAVWQAPTPGQWAALAGLGLLMAAAQVCFVNAIRRADASFVSPFWYATLVFAALYDYLIFAEAPDAVSGLGAAIIVAGAALLAWREARLRPSGASPSGTGPMPLAAPPPSPPEPPESQSPGPRR